jgi:hypothetical protein
VSWIVVQKQFHDVAISTYGRGLYVLDDITPLEQATPATTDAAAHLFSPRPAYRWSQRSRALINYSLKSEPRGSVQLQVLDGEGKVVRDLRSTPHAGLNRVTWDLRYEPPRLIAMRTTPPENPHIWEEPRFRGQDTRPVTHWGLEPAQVGPLVVPGKYTVKLTSTVSLFSGDRSSERSEDSDDGGRSRSVGQAAAQASRRHLGGRRHGEYDRSHA